MKFTFPERPASGYAAVDGAVVVFPVRPYSPRSPGVSVHAYAASGTVHAVVCDKDDSPLMTNWLILHKDALPDLILALQYLQAGLLGREAVKVEMEKS